MVILMVNMAYFTTVPFLDIIQFRNAGLVIKLLWLLQQLGHKRWLDECYLYSNMRISFDGKLLGIL